MFKLAVSKTFTIPVNFKIPADGGTYQSNSFIVEFKRLTVTEMKDLPKEGSDAEMCRRVVVGWNEIADENGNAIPFSSDALDKLLEIVGVAPAILRTFFESVTALQEKN